MENGDIEVRLGEDAEPGVDLELERLACRVERPNRLESSRLTQHEIDVVVPIPPRVSAEQDVYSDRFKQLPQRLAQCPHKRVEDQ